MQESSSIAVRQVVSDVQAGFEKEFALAAVEWTAAAKARHFALSSSGRPWRGFKSNNFVLCRADGARRGVAMDLNIMVPS
jgi:hypothetical protein